MHRHIIAMAVLASMASYGAMVYKAEYNTLDLDLHPMIVTNVTFDGLATPGQVTNIVQDIAPKMDLTPATNYTDSAISTNNAAFVAAVTNCPVAISAADGATIGDFGTYGTLGALLAALVAAITWLKNNKADKSETRYTMVEPSVEEGSAPDYMECTLQDKSMNAVTLGNDVSQCTFFFPQKTQGVARDFFLRLSITGSTVPTLLFKEQDDSSVAFDVDDDSWAEIEQGVNVIMFSDTKEGSVA